MFVLAYFMAQKGYNCYRSEIEAFKFVFRNLSLEFRSSEPAIGLLPPSATTGRSDTAKPFAPNDGELIQKLPFD
jgi:hypothetical protein